MDAQQAAQLVRSLLLNAAPLECPDVKEPQVRPDEEKKQARNPSDAPNARVARVQCCGIAASTGDQCKRFVPAHYKFCLSHRDQADSAALRQAVLRANPIKHACRGIKGDGSKCTLTVEGGEWCHHHLSQSGRPQEAVTMIKCPCTGVTSKGEPCSRMVKRPSTEVGPAKCWQH